MQEKILQKLWLNEYESSIYLYLIQNPKQNISDISKNLNINRPRLYKILPSMEESWLISNIIIGKRKYYIAENPEILNNYFEDIKNDFEVFIPKVKDLYQNNFSKPILKNIKGKHNIRNIFLDIANSLNKWDIFYRYSARNDVEKTSIARSEYSKYKKIREEKKLERMVITNEYLNSLKPNKMEKEVVVIPKSFDLFEDNITKIIYANKVAIIDYNSWESFIIESQIFANFEKKIFKLLFWFLRK